jgi:hypothetical protein
METIMRQIILIAGLAQITLAAGSLVIPKILNWQGELSKVRPIIKQIFWTYAAYILGFNLSFGFLSVFSTEELLNGSSLAKSVTGFIAVYWISRILIQFFYFNRSDFPTGARFRIGEIALVTLFVFLSAVYGCAFYLNCHI